MDRDAHPISDYRVLFSRGWLMVSERRADNGQWSAYRARLTLTYVDQNGKLAQMALLRHQDGNDPVRLDFNLVRPDLGVDQYDVTDEWTFTKTGGGLRTVTLLPFDPVLLPVNVVPSVQGILIADNVVKLSANLSTPGQSLSGSYAWTLERLDDAGAVVETIPLPAGLAVTKRLLHAGRYRATAAYTVDGPPQFTRAGMVEFTMQAPAPEVLSATVRDDRVLDGSLFLDLRLLQATRTDTFTVDVDWANDARGDVISKTYTVQCQDSGGNVPTCDTGPMILPEAAPTNANWSESPIFRIPAEQDFLPHVTVKITNGYGQVTTRSFPIVGDHRPSYDTMTPYGVMAAGKLSIIDLVEVYPSPLLTEGQNLSILPYFNSIVAQLPEGIRPDIEERNGHWYLQLTGHPQADAIGAYTFYFPFEQEPVGSGLRPPPALATLEIKAASATGYRSVLRGTPTEFADRQYRNTYPDYRVQVAQVLPDDEDVFEPFTGTVKCKLTAGPTVIFDKVCQPDAQFPWPTERLSDTFVASTYVESSTQPISTDGPYEVDLTTKFLNPTVTQVAGPAGWVRFQLALRDNLNLAVQPPFSASGYAVACSQDGGPFVPCLDGGTMDLPNAPGNHTLDVRVTAPDQAVTTERFNWTGNVVPPVDPPTEPPTGPPGPPTNPPTGPPSDPTLLATVTKQPGKASALTQVFRLVVNHGPTAVAPPFNSNGYAVRCVIDGGTAKPCFGPGTLRLPRVPGEHSLVVLITAPGGAATSRRVDWEVGTPQKKFVVAAPNKPREAGDQINIRARHLLPGEAYRLRIDGIVVASGRAGLDGRIEETVRIPATAGPGKVIVKLVGATRQRLGSDKLRVS